MIRINLCVTPPPHGLRGVTKAVGACTPLVCRGCLALLTVGGLGAGGGHMGEVQTDSPALVKVRAATYTSQIPARALKGPGFQACPEKLAVREIAVRAKWRTTAGPRYL